MTPRNRYERALAQYKRTRSRLEAVRAKQRCLHCGAPHPTELCCVTCSALSLNCPPWLRIINDLFYTLATEKRFDLWCATLGEP